VSATVGRDHVIDLVVGNRCPHTVDFNFVVVANYATLGRSAIYQIAARTLAIVSFELRVEALMPFIVARSVILLARPRFTQRIKETALPRRVMQFLTGMFIRSPRRRGYTACCARAAPGHAIAALPMNVTNSRRLISPSLSRPRITPYHIVVGAPRCALQKIDRRMAEMGQTEKSRQRDSTAGLPSTTDMFGECRHGS
jgi:hypothetical protein